MGFRWSEKPFALRRTVDDSAGIDEVPGGHPEDLYQSNLEANNERKGKSVPLRGTVGGNQARFTHDRLGAGGAEAGSFEIRPSLLRAILADGADIEAVTLGKRLRHTGFDLGGKAGQYGQRGGNERSSSDCRKSLDHDGPLSWALAAPSFRWFDL